MDETRGEWWQEVLVDAANPVKSPPNKLLKHEKISMPWVVRGPLLWQLTHLLFKNANTTTNICKSYTLSLEMAAVGAAFLHRISSSFGAWLTEYLLVCGNINAALLRHACCVLDEIEMDKICCFFSFFSISVHFLKKGYEPHIAAPLGTVGCSGVKPWRNTLSTPLIRNTC